MQLRLYGITFILAGIIMLIITVIQWLKFLSFRDCETTTATVTGVDKRNHFSNNHQSTTYSMKVAYNVDGTDYERKIACDVNDYMLGADRQVEILYKARNPKKILLNVPEKHALGQKILWIITLVVLAIGAAMMFFVK